MTKPPTHRAVPLNDIHSKYGATHFIPVLSCFIAQYQNPEYSEAQVKTASHSIHIPFNKLSVFLRIKFVSYYMIFMLLILWTSSLSTPSMSILSTSISIVNLFLRASILQ